MIANTDVKASYHSGFNDVECDITLCSTEKCLFRVHSVVLKTASGFFRSMLNLPQNKTEDGANEEVIQVDEPTHTLEVLLRIACGLSIEPEPMIPSLGDLTTLLYAAEKYEMQGTLAYLRALIMNPRFLVDPLPVYGLCWRYSWKEEAKRCIPFTFKLNFSDAVHRAKLDCLSGDALMTLLDIRWKRKEYLRDELDKFSGSAEPYLHRCNKPVDVAPWREMKLLILDAFDSDASGEQIKAYSFLDSSYARRVYELRCPNCNTLCFDKKTTVSDIIKIVDLLPLDM